MAGIYDYSSIAADNGLVGGVNIAEFCPAGNLNNGLRAIMADLATFLQAPVLGGNTSVSGTIDVSGVASFGDNLSIDGALTTSSGATINGNILLNQPTPTIALNSGGPRLAATGANRLGLFNNASPVERLVINAQGETHIFGANASFGTGNDIPGSGSLKVAASNGSYSISTYHDGDYTALQFVRLVAGVAAQMGAINVSSTGITIGYTSDKARKRDFRDFDSGAILDALDFGAFEWKADGSTGYGVLAQDAHAAFPYAVIPSDIEGGWAADYARFAPLFGNQIKKLRARIAALEATVEAMTPAATQQEGDA